MSDLMPAAQVIATLDGHIPDGINVTLDWTSHNGGILSVWLTDRPTAMSLLRVLNDLGPRRTIPRTETWAGRIRGVQVHVCLVETSLGRTAA